MTKDVTQKSPLSRACKFHSNSAPILYHFWYILYTWNNGVCPWNLG